jgi:hypothetical protein
MQIIPQHAIKAILALSTRKKKTWRQQLGWHFLLLWRWAFMAVGVLCSGELRGTILREARSRERACARVLHIDSAPAGVAFSLFFLRPPRPAAAAGYWLLAAGCWTPPPSPGAQFNF